MTRQALRLNRLDELRTTAVAFSTCYNFGSVLTRAIDLCISIARDGTDNTAVLDHAIKKINLEMTKEMKRDKKNDFPVRRMFFGLCECFNLMIESIIDQSRCDDVIGDHDYAANEEYDDRLFPQPAANSSDLEGSMVMAKEEVKEEPMDLFDQADLDTNHSFFNDAALVKEEEEEEYEEEDAASGSMALPTPPPTSAPSLATTSSSAATVTCQLCNMVVPGDQAFMRHFNSLHAGKKTKEVNKDHRCTVCLKSMKNARDLEVHMRSHRGTGRKPQCCKFCNKVVRTASELAIHMRTHTGEKPFPCTLCEKMFSSASEVKKHIRAGHKIKPHECRICGDRFDIVQQLRAHVPECKKIKEFEIARKAETEGSKPARAK